MGNALHIKLVCLLLILQSPIALSQCLLTGKVSNNGAPIKGAEITIKNNNAQLSTTLSRADGLYSTEYASPSNTAPAVQIEISAQGFANDSRIVFVSRGQTCPPSDRVDFALSQDASSEQAAGAPSFTIYISPFKTYGTQDSDHAQKFNDDLPDFIFHKIMSFKGDLPAGHKISDISINQLTETLTPSQGTQIRNVGHKLGALALVVGEMEVLTEQDSKLEMVSSVKAIPIFEDIELNSVQINDMLPLGSMRPSKIGRNLNDLWGKHAILSYVLQSLSSHQGTWKASDLEDLEDILISVKSTIRDENDPYKSMVDKLLLAVREKKS